MENPQFESWFKRHLPNIPFAAAQELLRYSQQGFAPAYLAHYEKEKLQNLSLAQIYEVLDAFEDWKELDKRRQHVLQELTAQSRLSDELRQTIERSYDLDRLEDIYNPFKLKRQTLGVQARDAGLGKLADYLWALAHNEPVTEEIAGDDLAAKAAHFIKEGTKFADQESVLKGVSDILVEQIAENTQLRSAVRAAVLRRSKLKAAKGTKSKPNSKYSKYFEYQEPVGSLKKTASSFRYLTIRRAWMEDELVLSFERPDEGQLLEKFEEFACINKESIGAELVAKAARLALKGNVYTVMENDAHRFLKESAEKNVTQALAELFHKKLLRAPLGTKAVLGVDAGSEANTAILVLIDSQGKYLVHLQVNTAEALNDPVRGDILKMLDNLKVEAVAIAHGPHAKELRELFRKLLEGSSTQIVNLHEHSASIYASSGAAKEEFPEFDISLKRAIFVARYLQDPLYTLLRLDTKYVYLNEIQHELTAAKLRQGLLRAVEAAIARVGIDLNLVQSPHILAKVPGLNLDLAKKILELRERSGGFKNKEALKEILELSAEKFSQVAPFLRVGGNSLDATAIHPQHLDALKDWAARNGATLPLVSEAQLELLRNDEALKTAIGATNVEFIAEELQYFGKDPRGQFEAPPFSAELKSIADLKKDHEYPAVVTNVTAFGVFVDLGLEQDGLVHISELSDGHRIPVETLAPGDRLNVWLVNINEEKKQISLSMRAPNERQRGGPRDRRGSDARPARRPRRNVDTRPQGEQANPQEGGQTTGPRDDRNGPRRDRPDQPRFQRRPQRPRQEQPPAEPLDPKAAEIAAIKAKKKMPRDPTTGAIVTLEDEFGRNKRGARGGPRGSSRDEGPRVAAKAKPHTFNPFANLGDMLKDKLKP